MTTFAADSAAVTYIGRWIDIAPGGVPTKVSISSGNRARFKFTGTSLALTFALFGAATGVNSIEYAIDGGAWTTTSVNGLTDLAIVSGLADVEHTFELWTIPVAADRWNTLEGIRLQGVVVDSGKVVTAWPTGLPKMLTLGDSIGNGDLVLADGSSSGRLSVSNQLAALIGYENWNHTAGGTGFFGTQAANGYPATQVSYLYKSAGVPRTDPVFDVIFIEAGQNDGTTNITAQYSTLLAQLAIDQPTAKVFSLGLIFPNPQEQTYIQAAAASYGAHYISTSGWVFSHPAAVNLYHPDVAGSATLAGYIGPIIQSVIGPTTTAAPLPIGTGSLRLTPFGLDYSVTPDGALRISSSQGVLGINLGGVGPVRVKTSSGVRSLQ